MSTVIVAPAAQHPTPQSPVSEQSLQAAINATLAAPAVPGAAGERRLGIFTFVTPTQRGAFLEVKVPVGELFSRAAKGVAAAKRRRDERAAQMEVARALAAFEASRTAK